MNYPSLSNQGSFDASRSRPASVLVVEDDPLLQDILTENLRAVGYLPDSARTGEEAWTLLTAQPLRYSAILLDRRMPGVDGLEILRRIKAETNLAHIPVIMQTAMTEPQDVLAGLRAGAHYYLTKPFSAETLLAIVDTAVSDYRHSRSLQRQTSQANQAMKQLTQAEFLLRTPAQAYEIAALLAHACPDAQRVAPGLAELLINAVEHGNLGISYHEKSLLIDHGRLEMEINMRLEMSRYCQRQARVSMRRLQGEVHFQIEDQGEGFDWQSYLEIDPKRAFDNHGRGIAMARMLSFDQLSYQSPGNRVLAIVSRTARAGGQSD